MDSFPDGMLLKPGFVFEITLPSGEKVPASVIEISDEMVTVDLNHPLAGRILLATIKVVAIVQ
ncbi:MAG TPA: hypothetical protein EYP43_00300 [Thermoplasmata archaeon]|nr:hypothetical protein [Thermoplasmata archaeon]